MDYTLLARKVAAELAERYSLEVCQATYVDRVVNGIERHGVPPEKAERFIRVHLRNWFIAIKYEQTKKGKRT